MHLVCPQNFAYALFSVSPGKAVIPRRDKKRKSKVTQYFCLGGGAGDDGGKQGVFIMGDVQMANSFHLNTGNPSRNYRQRNAFQINGFVSEFKMKENIPQSHIYPKASFVLRSFRPILWSYSAYFCPLSRRFRISCFPIHKLVRFYVNSSKKPNTSVSFTVAFSNIFKTILL